MISTCNCCGLCVCVHESEVAIVTSCGKFHDVKGPGLSCVPCCIGQSVAGVLSLRVIQLDVRAETKTKDNVFVAITVSVQYQVIEKDAEKAFYKLTNPQQQIKAYVCDVVRSSIPKIVLDEVFEKKEQIAKDCKEQLSKTLSSLGYNIKEALVTDIDPDPKVKSAMNEINAQQRLRLAAVEKAEAEKILAVKSAEAEAESKHLAGIGVARQRKAIAEGLHDSVAAFTENVHGASSQEVMDLVLITQYFDTLKDLSDNADAATLFIPHTPGSVSEIAKQIRSGAIGYTDASSQ